MKHTITTFLALVCCCNPAVAEPLDPAQLISADKLTQAAQYVPSAVWKCICSTNDPAMSMVEIRLPEEVDNGAVGATCNSYESGFFPTRASRHREAIEQLTGLLVCEPRVVMAGYKPAVNTSTALAPPPGLPTYEELLMHVTELTDAMNGLYNETIPNMREKLNQTVSSVNDVNNQIEVARLAQERALEDNRAKISDMNKKAQEAVKKAKAQADHYEQVRHQQEQQQAAQEYNRQEAIKNQRPATEPRGGGGGE